MYPIRPPFNIFIIKRLIFNVTAKSSRVTASAFEALKSPYQASEKRLLGVGMYTAKMNAIVDDDNNGRRGLLSILFKRL